MKQVYFYFLILLSGMCFFDCGSAKSTKSYSQGATLVDTAHYKLTYHFKFLKDTVKMIYGDDLNVVQIGDNSTKNYCFQTFNIDSVTNGMQTLTLNFDEYRDAILSRNTAYLKAHSYGTFGFYIYKDYRKKGMTVTDHISYHRFVYEDELNPQNWIILDDTMTVSGYSCQKAICSFRGRDWDAWFTPQIPISEGPYKFYGLPGLIMKLEDTESHYSFELNSFEKVNEPIYMTFYYSYRKMDRLSFLRLRMKGTETDLAAMEFAKIGITIDGSNVLHYDHIERDYK